MGMDHMHRQVQKLKSLQERIRQLQTQEEEIRNRLKSAMGDREELQVDGYLLRYKWVETARLDCAALKNALPDVAERFTRVSRCRRFTIN